ncbi:MAG: hypothetical protein ACLGHN_05720 [Bacteriovoracia bacterium]
MKTVIALILALNSFAAFAGFSTKFFSKSFKAETEAELVAAVEAAIPSIKNGTDRSVRQDFHYEGCWPVSERYIKIKTLSISKFYKLNDDGSLLPYYSGSLSFLHRGCRNER